MISSIAVLGFFVGLVVLASNSYIVFSSEGAILPEQDFHKDQAQAILVLGAAVTPDQEPSGILKDRLRGAVSLYQKQVASKIIVSGNREPGYDEPDVMKAYLVSQGIPARDIHCDYAGYTTYESLIRCKKVFGVERLVIVTQRYHLYRALYTAQALGITAWGFPTDYHRYNNQLFYDVREWGSRTKALFQAWIQPNPRVMDEPQNLNDAPCDTLS